MKRFVIVSILSLAVVIAAVVLMPVGGGTRPMGLAFVGFTNAAGRTEALFWFTNSAAPDFTWSVVTMSRKEPSGWVEEPAWTNAGPSRYTPMSSSGLALAGYEDLDLVGLPVWRTNLPVRVVVECFERENSKGGLASWIRQIGDRVAGRAKVTKPPLRRREVSGETVVQ